MRFKAHTLLESFRYAAAGVYFMLRTQRNIRIHLMAAFLAYGLGYLVGISTQGYADITIVAGFVVLAEMFNTAVENAVDLATH
ncbi:MAG: diacylglycerol kinase family protein, partial [Cyanobacteria bacterium REEB65]|nr:diacylglycerol kinase family protein [Cyanobacteria bacterium REEB65]